MSQFKYSGGAMAVILGGIAVVAVLVVRWLGQNAAQISAGIRVAGQVFILLLVCALITGVVFYVQKHRKMAAEAADGVPLPPPPSLQVPSERVPLHAVADPEPLALPAPGGDVHVHLPGITTAEQAASVIRLASQDRTRP